MKRSDKPINHPGRRLTLQYINYHCTAATPPSKGGEILTIVSCHKYRFKLTATSLILQDWIIIFSSKFRLGPNNNRDMSRINFKTFKYPNYE